MERSPKSKTKTCAKGRKRKHDFSEQKEDVKKILREYGADDGIIHKATKHTEKPIEKKDNTARNPAAWLYGVDDIRVKDFPQALGPLCENEVRVQIARVGICGSDAHYLHEMRCGPFEVKSPMVLGHETSGVVVEVGSGVTNLMPGDRVAMEPGIPCGDSNKCLPCSSGKYNLCPHMRFFATPPVHGSLAKFVKHPARWCYKLPEGVSLEEGAFCEPLSVGVHACRQSGVTVGSKVLILGAGPIGLVTLLSAQAYGAASIIVTDVSQSRLEIAQRLGAKVLNVCGQNDKAILNNIKEIFGSAVDICIDCCGRESTMTTAIACVRNGGRICLVGMTDAKMNLPMAEAASREIEFVGVFRYRDTYPLCIELLQSKRIQMNELLTNTKIIDVKGNFTTNSIMNAFATSSQNEAIKVMFSLL